MQELMQKVGLDLPDNWLVKAQDRAKTKISNIESGVFAFVVKGKDKFNRQVSIKTITDLNTEVKDSEILSGISAGISEIEDKTERVFVKSSFLNKVRPYAKRNAKQ